MQNPTQIHKLMKQYQIQTYKLEHSQNNCFRLALSMASIITQEFNSGRYQPISRFSNPTRFVNFLDSTRPTIRFHPVKSAFFYPQGYLLPAPLETDNPENFGSIPGVPTPNRDKSLQVNDLWGFSFGSG